MRKKRNNTNKKIKKIHTQNNKKQKINNTHTQTHKEKRKKIMTLVWTKITKLQNKVYVFLRKKT